MSSLNKIKENLRKQIEDNKLKTDISYVERMIPYQTLMDIENLQLQIDMLKQLGINDNTTKSNNTSDNS